ncbi:MAG TPA: lactonase family protein [Acidobacteriaceae bacterium]
MPVTSRRKFLAGAVVFPYALKAVAAGAAASNSLVYFGCDTVGKAKGIYSATWDASARKLTEPRLAVATTRPSYLAKHENFIYAVNAVASDTASVTVFERKANGMLVELNSVSAGGFGPAYIAIHPSGRAAYIANYFGGSISTFDIHADGTLGGPVSHFQYQGHGPNAKRQEAAHAHSSLLSPDARFLLVNDLGLDQIHIYQVDPKRPSMLTLNNPDAWYSRPGVGPRHLAFTPDGRMAFNINELDSSVDVLEWDATTGTLTTVGEPISTLPEGFKGENTAAEILVSADGRFAYASNRGEDSVVVFAIHLSKNKRGTAPTLTFVQRISCGGKTPRHITLSPDGRSLLAANQSSASVVIFSRDISTGHLTDTGNRISVPDPMFILFAG